MMVDRKGAKRIRIHRVPQTPEQKQADFNSAVERVRTNPDLTPEQQDARIARLRSAYLGIDIVPPQGNIFTPSRQK